MLTGRQVGSLAIGAGMVASFVASQRASASVARHHPAAAPWLLSGGLLTGGITTGAAVPLLAASQLQVKPRWFVDAAERIDRRWVQGAVRMSSYALLTLGAAGAGALAGAVMAQPRGKTS